MPEGHDGLTSFMDLSAEKGEQSESEYKNFIKQYFDQLFDLIEKEYIGDIAPLIFIKSRMVDFIEKENPS